MNPKIAAALNTLSLGIAELAEALNDSSDPVRSDAGQGSVPPVSPAPAFEESPFIADEFPQPSFADESVEFVEQGSEAVCPKHRIPYTKGTYGPYCKQTTDDPAWGKQKGDTLWCRITPKNAAEYLRIRAAA